MEFWIKIIAAIILGYFVIGSIYNYLCYPHPPSKTLAHARHLLKHMQGIRIEKQEVDCFNGYFCTKKTYTDGSSLYFR
jgi:hypothetical protein